MYLVFFEGSLKQASKQAMKEDSFSRQGQDYPGAMKS
jgi:hypothetical protein